METKTNASVVRLDRDIRTDKVTLGKLFIDDDVFCFVLELPWLDNAPNISCVPPDTYLVVREWSEKYQMDLFELKNVPGRSECKLHWGNKVEDTEGCQLLGESRDPSGKILGEPAVLESRDAFARFMLHMEGVDKFQIEIREV
ncbi:MAG: hypothetical protein JEY79_05540 [Pseudodesulfovibrio sp.]|nr:hypothetical protein [Pseudodesulfovibrio sp.]